MKLKLVAAKKFLAPVKKALIKKKKVDRDSFFNKKRQSKKTKERIKAQKEEALLEQQKESKKKDPKKVPKKGMGFLQRIISFISTILIGWIVNKLPIIIEKIKEVINKIKEVIDKVKLFFTDVGEFFTKIGKVIGNAWDVISNLSFENIKDLIEDAFGKLKDSFGNIFDKMKDGVKNFLGLSKKDTKGKTIDENTTEEDLQDPEFKSVIKDMQSSMGKMSGDLDQTTKKMEEVGTGSQISGSKGDDKVESTTKKKTKVTTIKGDLKTITFDGKTYSRGMPGLGGYIPGDGKGGSTYSNIGDEKINIKPINSSNIKLNKTTVSSDSITPNRKGKDIVVIDDSQEAPMMQSSSEGGSTQILVVGNSLNTLVNQRLLTDLAYT